ncbi:MAG: peptidoglycan-binding domain-containing protein [Pseudomonadota bacterium]
MSISAWLDQLPIEDWAAGLAHLLRRVRRRVLRRPLRTAGASLGALFAVLIGANALWDQTDMHPAPLWADDAGKPSAPALATHAPATPVETRVSVPEPRRAPSALVLKVQSALADSGYYGDAIDGDLGPGTRDAIVAFERDRGLEETGEPSVALLAALSAPEPADPTGRDVARAVLEGEAIVEVAAPEPRRAVLSSVTEIQSALNSAGFGPLTVDGVMGPKTQDALSQFAQQRGLESAGMTPALLRALAQEAR